MAYVIAVGGTIQWHPYPRLFPCKHRSDCCRSNAQTTSHHLRKVCCSFQNDWGRCRRLLCWICGPCDEPWHLLWKCINMCQGLSKTMLSPVGNTLTHWGWDEIDAISQTIFLNAFSWMKMYEFCLKFHWSSFLRLQLTIFQHWFR